MKYFKVEFKETYLDFPVVRYCITSCEEECIKFYGLREPDIEWFKIAEEAVTYVTPHKPVVEICSICHKPIRGFRHKADPVVPGGSCCHDCKHNVVTPAIIEQERMKYR